MKISSVAFAFALALLATNNEGVDARIRGANRRLKKGGSEVGLTGTDSLATVVMKDEKGADDVSSKSR